MLRVVALFCAVRLFCLLVLGVWSRSAGAGMRELLSQRWDSLWYERVAQHGYDFSLVAPDGRQLSSTAFFPMLPWLEEGISAVFGMGFADAGLVISAVASVFAVCGIYLIAEHLYSKSAALIAVCLWAALPVSIVQSMAYSESLFVALAAWALYSVMRGRWLSAGLLACAAGLTRPVGLAVAAAVVFAGVREVLRWRRERGVGGAELWRVVVAGVVAPLGAVGFVLWVGIRQGDLFGYLDVQAQWGNGFDGGVSFSRFVASGVGVGIGWPLLLVAMIAAAFFVHRIVFRQSRSYELVIYSGIVVAMAIGASGYFGSKPRLLMPAFPLLLPLAAAMVKAKPLLVYAVLGAEILVAALYGAFWLNGSGPP
ncbi:glycosyltransferase family 39 protein [Streptomyces sp. NBC_01716]|uniref:glycosyltransferase family 39 protein n=1 Tax=Streptomyces sp. NBC_01716 TaxID=2975917 RepID=UPI002E379273|nr:glycosyltransferase family 39 protein [Streptomyces sp. NBC_01716]